MPSGGGFVVFQRRASRPRLQRQESFAEELWMYRVTLQTKPTDGVELAVANQDLGRILALVSRLQLHNPSVQVNYVPEPQP